MEKWMGLLNNYADEDIASFSKDLFLVAGIIKNIDEEYGEAGDKFTKDFRNLKEFIKSWNLKYAMLQLSHFEDGMQLKVKVIIKDSKNKVLEAAARIDNLIKFNGNDIGSGGFSLKDLPKVIDLVYLDGNEEENSLTFEIGRQNEVLLIYEPSDLIKKSTPEFEIAAFYGLKSRNNEIDLQKFGSRFSFDTGTEESAGKGVPYVSSNRFVETS